MIPHVTRVLKMYILSMLEILKVRTTLGTLCSEDEVHSNLQYQNAFMANLSHLKNELKSRKRKVSKFDPEKSIPK